MSQPRSPQYLMHEAVLNQFLDTGEGPTVKELAKLLGWTERQVMAEWANSPSWTKNELVLASWPKEVFLPTRDWLRQIILKHRKHS